jgi:hypothetical protein
LCSSRLRPARRPDDRDVVDRTVAAGAGLVAGAKAARQAAADALETCRRSVHPAEQALARRRGQRRSEQQLLHAVDHRARAGGVARIAGRVLVQLELGAIEPRDLVAEPAHERGQLRRATELREQNVGRGVVAHGHDRRAQLLDRHPAAFEVLRRLGRVAQHVGLAVAQLLVELEQATVALLQHARGQQELEGRSHRIAGGVIESDALARARVERMHAEPATQARPDGLEPGCDA